MDGMTGLSLIQSCQNAHIPASIIVISGYAEFEYVQDAMYHDACCYLLKPITQESLFDSVTDRGDSGSWGEPCFVGRMPKDRFARLGGLLPCGLRGSPVFL